MASTDIDLNDFRLREYPYKSPQTMRRWAEAKKIRGAKKDPGGRWVVDMSVYLGIQNQQVANDTGLNDEIFKRLVKQ